MMGFRFYEVNERERFNEKKNDKECPLLKKSREILENEGSHSLKDLDRPIALVLREQKEKLQNNNGTFIM